MNPDKKIPMGIREANKYFSDLKKNQQDPFWIPDYLTGLPDRSSTIKRALRDFDRRDSLCFSLVRIININPYLAKYGTNKHAEIIQWAAASLKTTIDETNGFVGALDKHDFMAICAKEREVDFKKKSTAVFQRKIREYYDKTDLDRGIVFSFFKDGQKVEYGLMDFIFCTIGDSDTLTHDNMLSRLKQLCDSTETKFI